MSCAITGGYALDCRDAIGGLSAIYVAQFDATNVITKDVNGVITAIATASFKKYELEPRFANGYDENANLSAENGTAFWTQETTTQFAKMNAVNQKLFATLAKNRMFVVVETKNGEIFLQGEEFGAMLSTKTGTTGKNMGDFNGYNIVFNAMERNPASTLDDIGAITVAP